MSTGLRKTRKQGQSRSQIRCAPVSSPTSCQLASPALYSDERRFLTDGALKKGRFVTSGSATKPYFVPFQDVCICVAEHAAVGGKAHFSFDLNKNFKGYGLDLFALLKQTPLKAQDRLGEISFPTGKEAVQLQAADLLCYLSYQYGQRRVGDKNAKPDETLRRIIQGFQSLHDFPFYNKPFLLRLLEGQNVPKD